MNKNLKLITLQLIVLLFNTACAGFAGGPETGFIFDDSTKQPVEGAIVFAKWEGGVGIAHTMTACFHADVTKSIKDGSFYLPFWLGFKLGFSSYSSIGVIKEGFKEIAKIDGDKYYLSRFDGDVSSYLDLLIEKLNFRCAEQEEAIYKYRRELYLLGEKLSASVEDERKVNSLAFSAYDIVEEVRIGRPTIGVGRIYNNKSVNYEVIKNVVEFEAFDDALEYLRNNYKRVYE